MGSILVVTGMTHVFKRSLGAATAISAVLALGSTSAFAQEAPPLDSPESITSRGMTSPAAPAVNAPATPTVSLPQTVTPPVAGSPTIVLPQTSATVATPEVAVPAARASAAPAATAAETRATPARNTAAPIAAANPAPSAEAPVTSDALPAPVIPADTMMEASPESAMAPVAPVAAPETLAENASDGNMALAGLVGLLALVALGGAGFMLMRRRKPVAETEMELAEAEIMEPTRPINAPPAAVAQTYAPEAPEAPVYRAPEPAVVHASPAPLDANGNPVSPFVYNPVYQGKRPEDRPVFTMPAGPIPTGERRSALLMQMVAARPDAANPFTSPKWRMRRARSLLSRREKMLRDQATRPFDFRDFNTHTPIKPYRPAKPAVPHMA